MLHTARNIIWKWLGSGWIAAQLLLPGAALAQAVHESELKAAFIYNFIIFTEWPAGTAFERGTLSICVNPNGALRQHLQRLAGKSVNGRKILVRPLAPADMLYICNVLYCDAEDRDYWKKIRKDVALLPVLTIADDAGAGIEGSIITLATHQDRIVFDVDLRTAGTARLALSSKLLRLARNVVQ